MTQKQKQYNDVEVLYAMDDIIENIELGIQKAISMTVLGIDSIDAFTEVIALVRDLQDATEKISDEEIKFVALMKVHLTLSMFESKLIQLNTSLTK